MIRSFFPLDVLDILLQGGALANRAGTKDNIVRKETALASLPNLLGQWFNPQLKTRVWICTEGFTLRGVASVRNRSSSQAWEVDRLMLREQDIDCCISLLEHVGVVGGELAVQRVFLRLPATSPLLNAAEKAGFLPYATECLYWCEKRETEGKVAVNETSPDSNPRRKQAGDERRLFELYEKCVPVSIRRVEGLTFAQWQANKGRSLGQEWVFERGGFLVGWIAVRASRDMGQLEVIAASRGALDNVMEYGLTCLRGCHHLYCLAPAFDQELSQLLGRRGFSQVSMYSALTKELVVKAAEPCFMPAGA